MDSRAALAATVDLHLIEIAALLLAAGVVGALLPLYERWSERGLHVFVALAAGVFLGTIFLDLLPHMAGVGDHGHGAHVEHAVTGLGPWVAALAGLLLLFAIERVWLPTLAEGRSGNPHMVLWWATFVGLSLHALTAGVSLSAVLEEPGGRAQLLASLLIHKATETFSLATVMRLAGLSRKRMLLWLALFVVLEPTAFLAGRELLVGLPQLESLLVGFACGTFLYVATCDLLPEVFHGHDRPRLKLAAVLVGIAITAVSMPFVSSALDFGRRALVASLDVFLDLAPYLLLGLFAAGLVSLVLKRARLARKLAGNDLKSVLWAALFGAPLSLCSCSVVPVAVSLRRSGASKGATSAFAISTPETGLDSLVVSFVLLDPLLAIARPIGAIVSAVASGVAVNGLVRAGLDTTPEPKASQTVAACAHTGGHGHDHGGEGHAHGHSHGSVIAKIKPPQTRVQAEPIVAAVGGANSKEERGWFERVLRYAYIEMLDDLASSLVFGVHQCRGAVHALEGARQARRRRATRRALDSGRRHGLVRGQALSHARAHAGGPRRRTGRARARVARDRLGCGPGCAPPRIADPHVRVAPDSRGSARSGLISRRTWGAGSLSCSPQNSRTPFREPRGEPPS